MTERIDRAAEAQRLVTYAKGASVPGSGALYLAEAQVHATLALVEQQRIANLIALGSKKPDLADGATIRLPLFDPRMGTLLDEVRVGLGLS
ncbi:hypothetical protein [Microbacterium thalli]|uniref:hypothetical protein n=1 Tax=Microbacterium thalli TaxID=3027921 RepID=UPI00236548C4|nr:hypothetical protein [Microbacterium thalli]MDD7930102.1 hypothetical protein [Microbacterium thalli]